MPLTILRHYVNRRCLRGGRRLTDRLGSGLALRDLVEGVLIVQVDRDFSVVGGESETGHDRG